MVRVIILLLFLSTTFWPSNDEFKFNSYETRARATWSNSRPLYVCSPLPSLRSASYQPSLSFSSLLNSPTTPIPPVTQSYTYVMPSHQSPYLKTNYASSHDAVLVSYTPPHPTTTNLQPTFTPYRQIYEATRSPPIPYSRSASPLPFDTCDATIISSTTKPQPSSAKVILGYGVSPGVLRFRMTVGFRLRFRWR